jgi:alkanesulfonate monooxygenase SsuD/methylene tetrahydromethanopterin reductase-like flavin-dependent oxidoreductase (luciferase family)
MAKFGFRLPDFPLDNSDSPTFHRQIRENMDAVAEGGFDSAWVADHFIPWASWEPEESPTVECWTTLAHLSALYPDLTWGPIVLCQSYRNPAVVAKKVAAMCAFIPGKFVFGIGAGWKDNEYRMYNFPFPKASVRIKQMEEQIEIAKRLWTEYRVTWEGEHYAVYDCVVSPKPDPVPPVMVGGGGEKLTLRVAAKHADWWNFQGGTIDFFKHKLNVLKGHCDDVGRDFSEITQTWSASCVAVADTEEKAEEIARQSKFFTEDGAIYGTPDQVIQAFKDREAAGCDHFQIRLADFPSSEGIKRFSRDVLPHVR